MNPDDFADRWAANQERRYQDELAAADEQGCRDLGRQAYNNGDSFDDNPFSVGTFEREMWADGFESQRELCAEFSRKLGEYEESDDFLDWNQQWRIK